MEASYAQRHRDTEKTKSILRICLPCVSVPLRLTLKVKLHTEAEALGPQVRRRDVGDRPGGAGQGAGWDAGSIDDEIDLVARPSHVGQQQEIVTGQHADSVGDFP